METLLQFMRSLDPTLIYAILFLIAFIENIFPPAPSDMVVVFGGSLVGIGVLNPVAALGWTTLGSAIGFMVMYGVGAWFDRSIVEKRRPKFLPEAAIKKVEEWFRKYGLWIIVINRFLAGTRAVVSFCAGMAKMNLMQTVLLSTASALAWNILLLLGGFYLGHHWQKIGFYLHAYSQLVTILMIVIVAIILGHYLLNQRKRSRPS